MHTKWEKLEHRFRALGCPCELQLFAPSSEHLEAVRDAAVAEVERIESKYSRYREESFLSEINRSAGRGRRIPVDPETAHLLHYADTVYTESGGLFDITSGVLRRAWDFKSKRIPDPNELIELRKLMGWKLVRQRDGTIELPRQGMEIDFGGFGKEYAADRVAELCRNEGIRHGLVDFGGDLVIIGPHVDGSPWRVGIRDPEQPERAMASLAISHGALASSGDYERCIEIDGKRYSHLLDPRSGWPVSGLSAVSVVAEHCIVAGTGSTVAMLKGKSGAAWLAKLGLPHLWVNAEGKRGGSLWTSDGANRNVGAPVLSPT